MTGTRREFMGRAALALAGGALLATALSCGGPSRTSSQLAARLPPEARELGRAFLAASPEEADPRAAADALGAALEAAGVDPSDPAASGEALREMMKADCLAGRTLEVKEWVLSLTELRLCALVAA